MSLKTIKSITQILLVVSLVFSMTPTLQSQNVKLDKQDAKLRYETKSITINGKTYTQEVAFRPAGTPPATKTVENTNDSGAGSLRQAIADAASGDIIDFNILIGGDVISVTATGDFGGAFNTAFAFAFKSLTINGYNSPTSSNVIVQVTTPGVSVWRTFYITNGQALTLQNMTIRGGNPPGTDNGGGVSVAGGSLALMNSTVTDGVANNGGGIYSDVPVTIENSTISGNRATSNGGGISINGTLNLTNSTISGNTADGVGGGIYNNGADVVIESSTIANNHSDNDNAGDETGGGIHMDQTANLTIQNTILANNYRGSGTTTGDDYYYTTGTLVPGAGNNIVEYQDGLTSGATKTFTDPADILYNTKSDGTTGYSTWNSNSVDLANQNLNLATTLSPNGATLSETLDISTGSFAIGAGTNTVATDQIGTTRANPPTIGAFEYVAPIAPEMDVSGNSQSIADGDATPDAADDTDFGSVDVTTGTNPNTFTITNSGTAVLNLSDNPRVTIGGTHAADFTLTTDAPTTVASGGGTETFVITFDPSASGLRTATVSIANDDSDENPYNFSIQGTGTVAPAPEMALSQGATPIADGGSQSFGSQVLNSNTDLVFTITNSGNANLTLTTPLTLGGTDPGQFSIQAQPTTPVAGGGSTTTFTVRFTPTSTGAKTATISIANNDADENPYDLTVTGTGTAPEMALSQGATPIADGGSQDFGSQATGTNTDLVFTITNSGTANLTLTTPLTLGGTDPGQFSIQAQPTTPVAGGGSTTTFTVRFTPTTVGAKSATIAIGNNDGNENPYNLTVTGTGTVPTAPEMDVSGKGVSITHTDATPSVTDDTEYGNVNITGASVEHEFTITNTGTAALNLTGGPPRVTVSGTDFTLTQNVTTSSVASGGGTTTFKVTFNPSAAVLRQAAVNIANDDSDENPYQFLIQGTGVVAEMDVKGNSVSIPDINPVPTTANDTDYGTVNVGTPHAHTFTVHNTGTDVLNLTGTTRITITGTHVAEFALTTDAATTVAASGGTSDFTITFTPGAAGLRQANITIDNDDLDENPYNFRLQGTGATIPEMDVSGKSVSITDGDVTPDAADDTDFGSVDITTGTNPNTFTITNDGSAVLNLTDDPRVTISGTHAGDFTLTTDAPATVASGGGTETFVITFDPSATGVRNANVSIANDDADENPYNFAIKGNGTDPEMDVSGKSVSIADGDVTPDAADDTDFGSIDITTGTNPNTFTITNSGSAVLNLSDNPRVTMGGTHAGDFTLTTDAPATVASGGGTETFVITFNPSAVGLRTATVSIANNDADENPYNFDIKGTGTQLLLDFGDAPDPFNLTAGKYPTLLANDGARHKIVTGFCLGQLIDDETNGQQTADADGDDTDGTDDDDGITFGELKAGAYSMVDIEVSLPGGTTQAMLVAWMDFNADGDWDDTDEKIINNITVNAGTDKIQIAIPAGATEGYTFARFRLSIQPTGLPTGYDDTGGEVEDYKVNIKKDTDGDGIPDSKETGDRDNDGTPDNQDFDPTGWIYLESNGLIITGGTINVTGPGAVNIIHDGSTGYYQWTVTVPGTYTMSYTPPTGYLASTTCLPQTGPYDPTLTPDPNVIGDGSRKGTTDYMTDWICANNQYYYSFILDSGDPLVINNNFPLKQQPTGITLSSFDVAVENNGVVISWATATEANSAGFNIHRSQQESGEYVKINPSMIQALGSSITGASYSYTDTPEEGGTYYYKLEDVNLQGESTFHDPVFVSVTSVDIKGYIVPDEYTLSQNYPNPFNPETSIEFGLPKAENVSINIYDINGQLVRNLMAERKSAGNHSIVWKARDNNGTQVVSGVYFYYFKAGEFTETKKMILMK
jgi:hypothetical protein